MFNWTCTTCGRFVTIGAYDSMIGEVRFCTRTGAKAGEGFRVAYELKRCPNPECLKSDLSVRVFHAEAEISNGMTSVGDDLQPAGIGSFKFLPTTPAPLSATVPSVVIEDYQEAYLIKDLSPKASATLARRALQGMIRDFWQVDKATLHAELAAIESRCDAEIYAAMMAVKSVGNIGAHPERDIATIVEIEPGEPQQLLDVIHLLDNEWYVARAARAERIAAMKGLGAAKEEMRLLAGKPSGLGQGQRVKS